MPQRTAKLCLEVGIEGGCEMGVPGFLNLAIAVLWLFLGDRPSLERFLAGWLTGFLLIFVFQSLLTAERYVRRVLALGRLFWVLVREVVISSLAVLSLAWSRRASKPQSTFFTYDTQHLTRAEALLLGHFITLTPGTVTIDFIGENYDVLRIHVLDSVDVEASKSSIRDALENAITGVTRI